MTVEFAFITEDESWQIFDENARRILGIDADTFVKRWDAGDYAEDRDTAVMRVAMLRPSGR